MKIKIGDTVQVLMGKDKGKTSKVEKVFPAKMAVLVTDVNQYKRHIKGKERGQKSEVVVITKPIPASKVALICPKCKKMTRVGYNITGDQKVRVCRKCDQVI